MWRNTCGLSEIFSESNICNSQKVLYLQHLWWQNKEDLDKSKRDYNNDKITKDKEAYKRLNKNFMLVRVGKGNTPN